MWIFSPESFHLKPRLDRDFSTGNSVLGLGWVLARGTTVEDPRLVKMEKTFTLIPVHSLVSVYSVEREEVFVGADRDLILHFSSVWCRTSVIQGGGKVV